MKKGRNVVEMVVAKLPAPDKLMKGKSGARVASYDDEEDGDVGLESAITDFAKALGTKVEDMAAAKAAFHDAVTMCMHMVHDQEDDEEDDEE